MQTKTEVNAAINTLVAHFVGWLVLAPIAGVGFGALFTIMQWIAGLGVGVMQCYAAGWAVGAVLFSLEVILTTPRQHQIAHTHEMSSFPADPAGGWN